MKELIEKTIKDFAEGKMVIIVDDANRENEGDLVMAAEFCTPEKMAFMIRYTGGVVCVPLSKEIAEKFKLEPMIKNNTDKFNTPFAVSVDAVKTKTGISAEDRCITVKTFVEENAVAEDLSRPGHIFPLIAQDEGLKARQGHTEASVELCKLAGLKPIAVISEMMNDDGTMMRGKELEEFSKKFNIPLIYIKNIIDLI